MFQCLYIPFMPSLLVGLQLLVELGRIRIQLYYSIFVIDIRFDGWYACEGLFCNSEGLGRPCTRLAR